MRLFGLPDGRLLDRAIGLALLIGAWQAIHTVWGPFVLPSPVATLAALAELVAEPTAQASLMRTAFAALGGFGLGSAAAILLGTLAGRSQRFHDIVRPMIVVILGVPPIAWVILALLWFGASGVGGALTAALAIVPLVFAATLQGLQTLDPALEDMARAFGTRARDRLVDVRLPQIASHVVPALATAHGIAWKSVVMAEVLGAGTGLGGDLATARANLDLARAMALIVVVAAVVLIVDGILLTPLRRRVESWRHDSGPASGEPTC